MRRAQSREGGQDIEPASKRLHKVRIATHQYLPFCRNTPAKVLEARA
jgi:hypothetical protein